MINTTQKHRDINTHGEAKSYSHSPLNESFEAQKGKKSIDLTNEEISFIIQKLEHEILSNKILIEELEQQKKNKIKNSIEINVWKEENQFILNLIKNIKSNFNNKIGISEQFVLQALTPEQEDYIIESGLEEMRERRENGN